mgnify:CR=1 FL=1
MVNQLLNYLKKIAIVLLFVVIFGSILGIIGIRFNLDYSFLIKVLFLLSLIWLVSLIKVLLFLPKAFQKAFRKNKKNFFDQLSVVQKQIAFFLTKRWVKWGLIPAFLFFLGLGMSFVNLLRTEEAFSALIQDQKKADLVSWKTDELLTGEKIEGEFDAFEDNLGIVAVRFNTFERINDDWLVFRLKEKGEESWYYENRYKVDQFQPDELFPFGFPKIKDSKDKIYRFEIESTKGEPGNAVAISTDFPIFRTKYEFVREELMADKIAFIRFSLKKLLNIILNTAGNYTFLVSSFVFFIPLLFYLFYLLRSKLFFNLTMIEDFFSVMILAFLGLQLGMQIIKLLSYYAELEISSDGFLALASNYLLIWVITSGVIVALGGDKV